jgi:acetolactate synthase-1/2/3 large subunit
MPVLFISGQVNTYQMKTPEQRFNGMQEMDIISMVKPITKWAISATENNFINERWDYLSDLVTYSKQPRQGPVWLDIPLDVQAVEL